MDHHPPCIVATVVAVARNTRSSLDDIWHYTNSTADCTRKCSEKVVEE